jgi:hypothetical protein
MGDLRLEEKAAVFLALIGMSPRAQDRRKRQAEKAPAAAHEGQGAVLHHQCQCDAEGAEALHQQVLAAAKTGFLQAGE